MVTEYHAAAAESNRLALARYAELEQQKQEALIESSKIAKKNAVAAARARADADRLRKHIATKDSVSTATVASLRSYTATLAAVFGECVGEVDRLAVAADGHALDSGTLYRAWPR